VSTDPSIGDVVAVRVVRRNPWGLDVVVVDDPNIDGFIDPASISDEYVGGPADYPMKRAIIEAAFLGKGARGQNRFSLRKSDIERATAENRHGS
jgi:predicted RNA-binding protein with RPS1 domain